jgi:hypothetical protein
MIRRLFKIGNSIVLSLPKEVENREMVRFTLACAQSQLSLDEIAHWFKQYRLPAAG